MDDTNSPNTLVIQMLKQMLRQQHEIHHQQQQQQTQFQEQILEALRDLRVGNNPRQRAAPHLLGTVRDGAIPRAPLARVSIDSESSNDILVPECHNDKLPKVVIDLSLCDDDAEVKETYDESLDIEIGGEVTYIGEVEIKDGNVYVESKEVQPQVIWNDSSFRPVKIEEPNFVSGFLSTLRIEMSTMDVTQVPIIDFVLPPIHDTPNSENLYFIPLPIQHLRDLKTDQHACSKRRGLHLILDHFKIRGRIFIKQGRLMQEANKERKLNLLENRNWERRPYLSNYWKQMRSFEV